MNSTSGLVGRVRSCCAWGLIGQQVERHELAYQQHACASEPAVTEAGLCCLDVRLLHNQLPSVCIEQTVERLSSHQASRE